MRIGPLLIVGLGNPGPRYARTRHNLGFMVLDHLAERLGLCWQIAADGLLAEGVLAGRLVILLKPLTYMNRSGDAVAALVRRRPEIADIIVVHDDLDLPLGRLRIRRSGSAGGHRGVASVIAALGTEGFGRVRIGVDRPPAGIDATDYVLAEFPPEEMAAAREAVARATAALEVLVADGYEAAMSRFNG